MTTAERIKSNREMEARIAAKQAAEAPERERKAKRKLSKICRKFVASLPEADRAPVLEILNRRNK